MDRHRMVTLAVAEQAADWCIRLPTATQKENAEFVVWLRESPLHVREFFLAVRTAQRLRLAGPQLALDADRLYLKAQQNIVTFPLQKRRPGHASDGSDVATGRQPRRRTLMVATTVTFILLCNVSCSIQADSFSSSLTDLFYPV